MPHLHRQVVGLAEKHKCKVMIFSGKQLRIALLGDVAGTKHEIAEILVQKFPSELGWRLPPKRRAWDNEDSRMDVFDAVGLAVVFWMSKFKRCPESAENWLGRETSAFPDQVNFPQSPPNVGA